jgi:hypothetical protein
VRHFFGQTSPTHNPAIKGKPPLHRPILVRLNRACAPLTSINIVE